MELGVSENGPKVPGLTNPIQPLKPGYKVLAKLKGLFVDHQRKKHETQTLLTIQQGYECVIKKAGKIPEYYAALRNFSKFFVGRL